MKKKMGLNDRIWGAESHKKLLDPCFFFYDFLEKFQKQYDQVAWKLIFFLRTYNNDLKMKDVSWKD